jgi:hypothetical protein
LRDTDELVVVGFALFDDARFDAVNGTGFIQHCDDQVCLAVLERQLVAGLENEEWIAAGGTKIAGLRVELRRPCFLRGRQQGGRRQKYREHQKSQTIPSHGLTSRQASPVT